MTPAACVALTKLRVRDWSGRVRDNNWGLEHPICDNTNEQQHRDHDWRNEIFHGFSLVELSRRTGGGGAARSASDHNVLENTAAPKGNAESKIAARKSPPVLRRSLIPTRRGRLPACWDGVIIAAGFGWLP
jgi:hypothetical protein